MIEISFCCRLNVCFVHRIYFIPLKVATVLRLPKQYTLSFNRVTKHLVKVNFRKYKSPCTAVIIAHIVAKTLLSYMRQLIAQYRLTGAWSQETQNKKRLSTTTVETQSSMVLRELAGE